MRPGMAPDVGAAVAANVGLVARPTQGNADVLTPHRPGDRLGHRGLTDARRTDKEQNRPLGGTIVLVAARRCIGRRDCGGRLRHIGRFTGGHLLRLMVFVNLARGAVPVRSLIASLRLFLLQPQLTHGQEFQHPVLDVTQRVVILIQNRLRLGKLQMFLAPLVPGKLGDVLQECPDHLRFH